MNVNDSRSPKWESAIYKGFVRHRRFSPRYHEFRYPLFMTFIKLSELDQLTSKLWFFGTHVWHWVRFRRADYVGNPTISLQDSVKQKISESSGIVISELNGEVFFYGHLRFLGFYFSPLNFYFLEHEGSLRYMLAEVSNTPWDERHYYVIDLDKPLPHKKQFHVSPFNPMEQRYSWHIRAPSRETSKSMVHLEVAAHGQSTKLFDATMVLKRKQLNQINFLRVLVLTPMQTLSMVIRIYWQALKLYLKGVPFHAHPEKQKQNLKLPR